MVAKDRFASPRLRASVCPGRRALTGTIAVALGLFAGACAPRVSEAPAESLTVEQAQALEGQAGVLGAFDFTPLDEAGVYTPLADHIGVFAVIGDSGDNETAGVATAVLAPDGAVFLMTAGSLVYLPNGERIGMVALFAHKPSETGYVVDLTSMPERLPRPSPADDILYIPLDYEEGPLAAIGQDMAGRTASTRQGEGLAPFAVPAARLGLARTDLAQDDVANLTPVSVAVLRRNGAPHYFIQDTLRLAPHATLPWPAVSSDIDAVQAMVGSPIFVREPNGAVLAGLVAASTVRKPCAAYDPSVYCDNVVIMIEDRSAALQRLFR